MGSLINGITSGIGSLFGGGKSSASANNNAGSIAGLSNIAGQQGLLAQQQVGLADNLTNQGNDIFGPSFNEFQAGASGQLTPANQALVTQNLGQMDLGTEGVYGNLGLGGSTMQQQDMNTNSLRSLAEQANLDALEQTLGLQGLSQALGYFGGAEGALRGASGSLGGATTALGDAGQLQTENTAALNKAIGSLGNKSAGGGGGSGLLGAASSLFGGSSAAPAAAGAVGGGDALGAAATGAGAIGGADLLGAGAGAIGGDALLGAAGGAAADAGGASIIADLAPAALALL